MNSIRAILEDMIVEFTRGKGASYVITEAEYEIKKLTCEQTDCPLSSSLKAFITKKKDS